MQKVQHLCPDRVWTELSLVITDDEGIRPLNRAHFNRDHATDVISFNYTALPGEEGTHSGEVIVNIQRAVEIGEGEPGGTGRELAWYIAHGCHHLTDAEDHTDELRSAMHRREQQWLDEAERLGLLEQLTAE